MRGMTEPLYGNWRKGRERYGQSVKMCAFHDGNWTCSLAVTPGYDFCHHHAGIPKRVIDRLTEAQIRTAATMFANGAPAKAVGAEIGLTSQQAQNLKTAREFPDINYIEKRIPQVLDFASVGEIKGPDGRWRTIFGPVV